MSHAHVRSIYTTQNFVHQHTVVSQHLKSATPRWPRHLPHVHSQICFCLIPHTGHACVCMWVYVHESMHMCVSRKWVTSDTDMSLYGPQGCIITFIFLYLFSSSVPPTPHLCVHPVASEMWSIQHERNTGKEAAVCISRNHWAFLCKHNINPIITSSSSSFSLCCMFEWPPLLIHWPSSNNLAL